MKLVSEIWPHAKRKLEAAMTVGKKKKKKKKKKEGTRVEL